MPDEVPLSERAGMCAGCGSGFTAHVGWVTSRSGKIECGACHRIGHKVAKLGIGEPGFRGLITRGMDLAKAKKERR